MQVQILRLFYTSIYMEYFHSTYIYNFNLKLDVKMHWIIIRYWLIDCRNKGLISYYLFVCFNETINYYYLDRLSRPVVVRIFCKNTKRNVLLNQKWHSANCIDLVPINRCMFWHNKTNVIWKSTIVLCYNVLYWQIFCCLHYY